MKADLAGFLKCLEVGKQDAEHPHVIVPLIGQIKGETGKRCRVRVLARKTKVEHKAGPAWADSRLAVVNKKSGRQRGPLFQTKKGHWAKLGDFESEFLERMTHLKLARPGLFKPGLWTSLSCAAFSILCTEVWQRRQLESRLLKTSLN